MQCATIKPNGDQCRGKALPGSRFCFSHDPALAARRLDGSRRGGAGKANAARARKHFRDLVLAPEDVNGLLSDSLVKVAQGKMEPAVGSALASMSRALLAVQEATTLSDRLTELERIAGIEPANVTPIRKTA